MVVLLGARLGNFVCLVLNVLTILNSCVTFLFECRRMHDLKNDLDKRIPKMDLTITETEKLRANCWWAGLKKQMDAYSGTSTEDTALLAEKTRDAIEDGKLNLSERDVEKALAAVKTFQCYSLVTLNWLSLWKAMFNCWARERDETIVKLEKVLPRATPAGYLDAVFEALKASKRSGYDLTEQQFLDQLVKLLTERRVAKEEKKRALAQDFSEPMERNTGDESLSSEEEKIKLNEEKLKKSILASEVDLFIQRAKKPDLKRIVIGVAEEAALETYEKEKGVIDNFKTIHGEAGYVERREFVNLCVQMEGLSKERAEYLAARGGGQLRPYGWGKHGRQALNHTDAPDTYCFTLRASFLIFGDSQKNNVLFAIAEREAENGKKKRPPAANTNEGENALEDSLEEYENLGSFDQDEAMLECCPFAIDPLSLADKPPEGLSAIDMLSWERERDGAICIQKAARMIHENKSFKIKKNTVLKMQAWSRGKPLRKEFMAKKKAAIMIGKASRGRLARRLLATMKAERDRLDEVAAKLSFDKKLWEGLKDSEKNSRLLAKLEKKILQQVLIPVERRAQKLGTTPNNITQTEFDNWLSKSLAFVHGRKYADDFQVSDTFSDGAADVEALLRKVVESKPLQGFGGAARTTFGMLVDAPERAFRDEVAFCGEDWRSGLKDAMATSWYSALSKACRRREGVPKYPVDLVFNSLEFPRTVVHHAAHFGLVELTAFLLELGVCCYVTAGASKPLRANALDLAADIVSPESPGSFLSGGRETRYVPRPSSLPPGRMLKCSLKEMEKFERGKHAKLGHLKMLTKLGQKPGPEGAGGFGVVVGFRVMPWSEREDGVELSDVDSSEG